MLLMQGVIATLTLGSQPRFGGHDKGNESRMRSTNLQTHEHTNM